MRRVVFGIHLAADCVVALLVRALRVRVLVVERSRPPTCESIDFFICHLTDLQLTTSDLEWHVMHDQPADLEHRELMTRMMIANDFLSLD